MIHEEKKHFPVAATVNNTVAVTSVALATSKVSPIWTMDDINSLQKGIVRIPYL